MIDEPDVRLELVTAACPPGGELTGAFVIPGGPPPETKRVELSVLWHTSGKGTEDLGVIHYEAWTVDDRTLETMPNPGTFTVRLPLTPWSYDGTLVKIHWLARVRMRWEDEGNTRELVREAEFTLSPRLR
jgi:hypothetical protein